MSIIGPPIPIPLSGQGFSRQLVESRYIGEESIPILGLGIFASLRCGFKLGK
jgi:hypothetical protein